MMSKAIGNPYGLRVITELTEYEQQVAQNHENELVDLAQFISDLRLDIRYATSANVLGTALYVKPVAYLRRPAAEALRAVQTALQPHGLGLLVFDAYRPYRITVRMYEQIQDEDFAAPPWRGSRHNRGCSVDVALVELASGKPLPMPTDFDALTPAAHTGYANLPTEVLRNRTTLIQTMTSHGFVSYPGEWWHFDYQRWTDFDLLDIGLQKLKART